MKLKRKFGLILYIIPSIFLVILLILEIQFAKKEVTAQKIAYRESSGITYKTLLKPNTYYDTPYLDENYTVVASLIDKFIVNYNYLNTFSTDLNYSLKYDVKAKLNIYDTNNNEKPIYTKDYVLVEPKETTGKGLMAKVDLNEQDINYYDYNVIVEQFKREVVPEATLVVSFNTTFKGTDPLTNQDINSSKTSTLSIPISQKTINLDIKKTSTNKEELVIAKKKLRAGTIIIIVLTVILFIIFTVIYILYVIKTAKKKSKYVTAVEKILREYDRAITESKSKLRLDRNANTIEVKDFQELLDVHDNFNIPIIYYKLSSYACVFVVKYNDDIYFNVMKSDDYN